MRGRLGRTGEETNINKSQRKERTRSWSCMDGTPCHAFARGRIRGLVLLRVRRSSERPRRLARAFPTRVSPPVLPAHLAVFPRRASPYPLTLSRPSASLTLLLPAYLTFLLTRIYGRPTPDLDLDLVIAVRALRRTKAIKQAERQLRLPAAVALCCRIRCCYSDRSVPKYLPSAGWCHFSRRVGCSQSKTAATLTARAATASVRHLPRSSDGAYSRGRLGMSAATAYGASLTL